MAFCIVKFCNEALPMAAASQTVKVILKLLFVLYNFIQFWEYFRNFSCSAKSFCFMSKILQAI